MKPEILNVLLVFIVMVVVGTSCDEEIDVPSHESIIVVDGKISAGEKAQVRLTYSLPYLLNIDSSNYLDYRVTAAKVFIECDGAQEILALKRTDELFPPYMYETLLMTGQVGKTYKLFVVYKDDTLFSQTTIPQYPQFDSAYKVSVENSDTNVYLKARIIDNAYEKNYYRVMSRRNNIDKSFIPCVPENLDDRNFNGETFVFPVLKGFGNNLQPDFNTYFNVSNVIVLKISAMNKDAFDFWSAAKAEYSNASNPFSNSKGNLPSNINGGFGLWAGYASKYIVVF